MPASPASPRIPSSSGTFRVSGLVGGLALSLRLMGHLAQDWWDPDHSEGSLNIPVLPSSAETSLGAPWSPLVTEY